MPNTKERHEEIYSASVLVLDQDGGVTAIDNLPQSKRVSALREMAKEIVSLTDCHISSARRNLAKAMRRARYGITCARELGWGGKRSGTGRPPTN